MQRKKIVELYNALYPEELLERYNVGERNFPRINLLRAELEHIYSSEAKLIRFDDYSPSKLKKFNPLWVDFRSPNDFQVFEWDSHGTFIPVEYDDLLPPRNLNGADLNGINLEGSYLYPVNLANANLSGANLRRTILFDANLEGANLSRTDLRRSILHRANLRGANLYMARLERSTLVGCDLRKADLRRAKLQRANLASTDLREADLRKAHFGGTSLNWANLTGTNLQDVELDSVFVRGIIINSSQQSDFLAALSVRLKGSSNLDELDWDKLEWDF